jgi:cell division protease FtsH
MALGVTFSAPESDRFNYREPEVLAKIGVALGGRAAEEIVFGETSTGAESDIQQLTEIARQMVGRWGMSSAIGPVAVVPRDGAGPFASPETSSDTQRLVDEEVRRIVEESHRRVLDLLRENRGKLDSLAQALLEHETLDEDDAYAAAGVPHAADRSGDGYSAAARSRSSSLDDARPGSR